MSKQEAASNTGSQSPRRMKTYTGGQGYVYQYYFVGKRRALGGDSEAPAWEYIFDVSSDPKTTFAVSIFLGDGTVRAWETGHERKLNEAEQYGAVKLRLFSAFDEVEDMLHDGRRLSIDRPTLGRSLDSLGVL
jgi:hypothetical protein